MAYLTQLAITHLRNLESLQISPNPQFNVILGENGSGKTSLLEGIYLLGMGKSFRSHLNRRLIQDENECLQIHGVSRGTYRFPEQDVSLGIEKRVDGKTTIRAMGENQNSVAELASFLPLQLINPDGYRMLEDGPKFRRQFLDWGVFHVEHSFLSCWQRIQRALKQRNRSLQMQMSYEQVAMWDQELVEAGEQLHDMRLRYMENFIPCFHGLFQKVLPNIEVTVDYYPGWTRDKALSEIFKDNYQKDLGLGYTSAGPQRADVKFKVGSKPAVDVLSRGQQKVLFCALKLAQGLVLQDLKQQSCVYLIDDLAAELDEQRRKLMLAVLQELKAQVFVTGVEEYALKDFISLPETKVFHVEQLV